MLCSGMWGRPPLQFGLLTFKNRPLNVQRCPHVQSCVTPEKERGGLCVFMVVVRPSVCVLTDANTHQTLPFAFSATPPVCRSLCSHVERPPHNNEKWQKREYHSGLWPGLAASVRPRTPRWQSPYFWEDGSVIWLIYFTPLPCNWTLGLQI